MSQEKFYKDLPDTPGVYIMKGRLGKVLYIGKAAILKKRVASYFVLVREDGRPGDGRIEKLVSEIRKVNYKKTDSALEALILESELIKKYQPPYNVREKDDKSFLYVEITKDKFPRVLLVRGKNKTPKGKYFGPFTSASGIREALKILRKIFPFGTHSPDRVGKFKHPCFDYEIGLCPGTCVDRISKDEYLDNIRGIKLLLQGKKKTILKKLKKEIEKSKVKLEFERAGRLRKQIVSLQYIQDVALITEGQLSLVNGQRLPRIEGYDVSNISGTSAVGSMVVFMGDEPVRSEYKKFKIKTINQPDPARHGLSPQAMAGGDVGMLKEVLGRRLGHEEWLLPDLILIDGGKGQVSAVEEILSESGFIIPVVGIAKGPERKKNEFIGEIPKGIEKETLIKVRDEAHRFAIAYHREIRNQESGIKNY